MWLYVYICIGSRQPSPSAPPQKARALSVLQAGPLLGFVKRSPQQRAIWQRSPSHSLLFVSRRELRGQALSVERVHSYLFMFIKTWGTVDLDEGLSDPWDAGRGGRYRLPPHPCSTGAGVLVWERVGATIIHSVGPICVVRPIVPVGRVTDCL